MQYMTRNFILSLTAALPLLVTVGCGDNGGGTTETASSTSTGGTTSTTDNPTMATTEPATTEPATTEPATTTGDTSSTTEPATTEPATTTGDTSSTTDVTATTGEPDTTTATTGDPLSECLMMVEPDDMCGQCACTNCTAEYQDCQADMGCAEIFKCVQESGCTGQDCIVPCGATIQENGGFMGEPAAKAITLGMCIGNNCMAECGG